MCLESFRIQILCETEMASFRIYEDQLTWTLRPSFLAKIVLILPNGLWLRQFSGKIMCLVSRRSAFRCQFAMFDFLKRKMPVKFSSSVTSAKLSCSAVQRRMHRLWNGRASPWALITVSFVLNWLGFASKVLSKPTTNNVQRLRNLGEEPDSLK